MTIIAYEINSKGNLAVDRTGVINVKNQAEFIKD